jgi:hypothetical protein
MTRSWRLAESESVIASFVLQSYKIDNDFLISQGKFPAACGVPVPLSGEKK